jgi:hypothetical protein
MDEQNGEWVYVDDPTGPLHLWIHPDGAGDLPRDRTYAMGIDIATGTGASNSVLSIGDCKTGEKVGEFVIPTMRPDQLARQAVAIARWFRGVNNRGAFMVWEAAGPGRIFTDVVINDLNYREVYLRKSEGRVASRHSDIVGWYPTRDTKITLFGNYRTALYSESFINRSAESMKEHREIVYTKNGSIEHARSQGSDPSGARMNHGDRVTADALLWMVMSTPSGTNQEATSFDGSSFGSRRMAAIESARKAREW